MNVNHLRSKSWSHEVMGVLTPNLVGRGLSCVTYLMSLHIGKLNTFILIGNNII